MKRNLLVVFLISLMSCSNGTDTGNIISGDNISNSCMNITNKISRIKMNLKKLNVDSFGGRFWGNNFNFIVYFNQKNQIKYLKVKQFALNDKNDKFFEEYFFANDGGDYILKETLSDSDISIFDFFNKSSVLMCNYRDTLYNSQKLVGEDAISKISTYSFILDVYKTFFPKLKFTHLKIANGKFPVIQVNLDTLLLYSKAFKKSKVISILKYNTPLFYLGIKSDQNKSKNGNKFWFEVKDLRNNKFGWIYCSINDLQLYRG